MEKLKVGIISLQHLHPISYLPHLQKLGLNIVAVAEESSKLTSIRKSEFSSNQIFYEDYREMITIQKPDIVFIFSSLDKCPEVVEFAAKNRVNLVIEKPLAATLQGGERILKYCLDNKIIASVPYVWRYHPVSREIKKLIKDNVLGEIQMIEGRCIAGRIDRYISANSEWILQKEKAGGGSMWNLGCHWIDLFRWFLEFPEIDRVSAEYSNFSKNISVEENSVGLLKFKNGVICTLNIGYSSPPSYPYGRDLHINIRGTLGSLTWNPAFEGSEDEIFLCTDHPEYSSAPNRSIKMKQKTINGYGGMMGFEYLTEYVGCVKNGKKPFIDVSDALEVLKITDGLNRASATGQVIKI